MRKIDIASSERRPIRRLQGQDDPVWPDISA
jgi:hypothetical protein